MADLKFFSGPSIDESVSQTTATPSVQLGTRVNIKGEDYVYCYNASATATGTGVGVKLITGASGYSVAATCLTDVFNPCVGVVKHTTIGVGEYGWVMTRGFASVKLVSASTNADGFKMIALGEDGYFIAASGTTVLGTATVCGYLLAHNTAASATAYAFIRGIG